MKHCEAVTRMKAACANLQPRKLSSELSNLETEMDEIAKLLARCCNDYIINGDAEGLKYLSKINEVKTFLPEPATYRYVIESSCGNPSYSPANPEFYRSAVIRVVEGTVTFKSLFSLEAAEESVEKFVVLQVGQRAALILVSLARIALMQSRFHTALACCRVGLILVRLLYTISSPGLVTSHKILFFLLAAEAVESCTLMAAFDHPSCCRCAEIMDKAVWAYHDFLNIFRSYGDGLTNLEEDLMLSDGGSLSDIRTIVEKLAMELVDWSAGNDLLFNFSMFYFHLACKDVAALRGAPLSSAPPQDLNVELCVRGFQAHPDSYMMAAALFCRGCFRSASGTKGFNQERTTFLMAAESDFLDVLNITKTHNIPVSSIPWLRLVEKASIANLITRCRILVRCATTFDVHHFLNSLDHLYLLMRMPSSHRLEDGISSGQKFSAVASLAFIYFTDHTPGAPDVLVGSAKALVSRRRAECESLASQLLEDEATFSFCLKVFCDLAEEWLGGEDVLSNGETLLHRCLHRLKLLSMPIFTAVTRSGSPFKRVSASNETSSAGSKNIEFSPILQDKLDDVNTAGYFPDSDCSSSHSSESEDTVLTRSSPDDLGLHKNPSQLPNIPYARKTSKNILLDSRRTSSNEIGDELRSVVNTKIKMLKFQNTDLQAFTDDLETSKQLCFEEKSIAAKKNPSPTVGQATLKAQTDCTPNKMSLLDARSNDLQSQSTSDENISDNETRRTGLNPHNYDPPTSNEESSTVNDVYPEENINNWSESTPYDLVSNTRSHFHCRIQSINSTENNPVELQVANPSSSEPYHVFADTGTIHIKPKQLNESLKIDLEALTDLNKGPSSINITPKFSVQMESSDSVPPVVSEALEEFVSALLDRGFDILCKRTDSRKEINESPNSPLEELISTTANEEWVAEFPPDLTSSEGAGKTNQKSEPVMSREVTQPFGVKQLSLVIKEAAAVLEGQIKAKANDHLGPILKEHPTSRTGFQCGLDKVLKSKFKRLRCKLPADTENWLLFLKRSSLLTTVEDRLDDLFFIDGTDDLLILKNTIAKDLQNLCRATIGDHGSQNSPSSNNPAYLSVFAHCAYTTALQHLKRSSSLEDFHFLLMTLFEVLDENPFGSADQWT